MRTVTPSEPQRHPATELFSLILADAIALAVQRPDVIEALRVAFTTPAPKPKPTLITKQQLATEIGKSTSSIDRFDKQGAPHTYCGDQKRYALAEYTAWLSARGKRPAVSG